MTPDVAQALAWAGLALVPLAGVAGVWGLLTGGRMAGPQFGIRVTWRDGGEQWATDPADPRRLEVYETEAEAERRCAWLWHMRGALEVAALDVVPYPGADAPHGGTDGD